MEDKKLLHYFKVNVSYPVGVRFNTRDEKGRVLTANDPYVAVDDDGIRDFKRANKHAIINGLIASTTEPNLEYDTPNMIDDDKAAVLVMNVIALKNALKEITSEGVVEKLLVEAKLQKRPAKTIQIIEKKLAELSGDEDEDEESPAVMKGVG